MTIHIDDIESTVDVIPEGSPGDHPLHDAPDLDALLRQHEGLRKLAAALALRTEAADRDD